MPRPDGPVDTDLGGLGVLVTRPAHQADGLCRLLETHGGRPYRFPLLAVEPTASPERLNERLVGLNDYWLVIFISPNAVTFSAEPIRARGGLPVNMQLAVVGNGTARSLKMVWSREPDIRPQSGFNSEALLAQPALQQVAGRRILIVRGEGGRELLADTLRGRGAEVDYAEAYRRIRPALDGEALRRWVESGEVNVAIVTSGEALTNLARLYAGGPPAWLKALPLLVVSERLVGQAREYGFRRVGLAPEPGDEGLLAGLAQADLTAGSAT